MRYSTFLTSLLLTALLGGASSRACAHYDPVTPDLDLVPSDCDGFITARIAQLGETLALKKADGLPLLDDLEKNAGLRVTQMERLTAVILPESRNPVCILHTTRPLDRIRVLKAFSSETKEVKYRGQVIYVKNNESAICFFGERIFVVGSEKDIRHLLATKEGRPSSGPLAAALARAATHDVVAWLRAIEPNEEATSTRSSYKTSRTPKKKTPVVLGTLGSPDGPRMLPGATSADLTLDIGKQLTLQVNIHFADEESAQRGVKYVRVGVEMLRAMIATQSAALSMLEVSDELGIEKDVPEIPPVITSLIKKTEKELQRVKVEAQGTTVPVSLTIPADARTVSSGLFALMKVTCDENSPIPGHDSLLQTWKPSNGLTLPSDDYLKSPLDYLPRHPLAGAAIGGAVGAGTGAVIGHSEDKSEQREAQAHMLGLKDIAQMARDDQSDDVIIGHIRSTGSVFRLSATDLQWLKEIGVSDRVISAMQAVAASPPSSLGVAASGAAVGSASTTAPAAEPLPPPLESVNPQARYSTTPTVSPTPVKLAIANVARESALLFLQSESGKLTFERKVPAGEAIDVETPPGQRWVAIFADNPASENYVASPDKTTWLLRGTLRPVSNPVP